MDPTQLPVQIQTVSIILPNVTIYYPMVTGLQNANAEESINQAIYQQVQALIAQQGFYQNPAGTQMTGYYEIKTNERGILSLTLGNYAYIQYHAHGLTILKAITADIHTGRIYRLQDLFKPGSDYVRRLSDLIRVQIRQRNIPLLNDFKGIRPDQDFYIADKSLVVYFQLYEMTPYYYGFPMFPISVYELQDILDENGPLGKMLPG
ncbi:DUF3298 and DUF4163 domain-containing protein [Brevibacillus massiliensis]|uniref:DUF3298 and DUF4163 domain-containing protein n=1 Tax=Brevibacillus massiliensis TaxID=1118054 RepID=UPI000364D781|nr:DUF3298 and DUF4163 domain-containing protein [Brevibacillus massiliensis]